MATQQTKTIFGAKPKGARVTELSVIDQFAETPFFAPGMTEDSEHMKALPVGSELVGYLRDVRVANKNNPTAKPIDIYKYGCLETTDGQKFRVKAPGNLGWSLENQVSKGDLISIVYNGKDMKNPDYPQGVHNFTVSKIEIA
mgnify:CR=1 FL=1